MSQFALLPPTTRPIRRRPRRDPHPRFVPDRRDQLDAVHGCPSLQVPEGHLAREVWRFVERLDLTAVEVTYSSLGRRGYHPRNVLAVWIYASRIGLHHATKLETAMKTDAVLRFLGGGASFSASVLRRFRQRNEALFQAALVETVKMAIEQDALKPDEMAVDSVRLRAHASSKAVRTLARSKTRLEELAAVAVDDLAPEAREAHAAKLAKHKAAVEKCEREARPNYVETCASAGFLKFPDGATAPGHRVNVAACGVRERIVVGVLIDADNTDWGKLAPTVGSAVEVLRKAGLPDGTKLQVAADPGYYSEKDLVFAVENRSWIDVLIRQNRASKASESKPDRIFPQSRFRVVGDVATCPAGTVMRGPYRAGNTLSWQGRGCAKCALKPQCTTGKHRQLTTNPAFTAAREAMDARMALPDGKARYAQRMATVEPVFADVEAVTAFRRVSSRHTATVRAEILLKLLAHNIACLANTKRRLRWFFVAI